MSADQSTPSTPELPPWQHAEHLIATALRHKGFFVLNFNDERHHAPLHSGDTTSIITPDLDIRGHGFSAAADMKWKTDTTYTRKTGQDETGIDANNYAHYRHFEMVSGVKVWLFFLHEAIQEIAYAPLAGYLFTFARFVPPDVATYGKGGMVYFPYAVFRRALLEDFQSGHWDARPLLYRSHS